MILCSWLLLLSCTAPLQPPQFTREEFFKPYRIPRDHWAYDSATFWIGRGIFNGYPGSGFQGERAVTREEFVAVMQRFERHVMDTHRNTRESERIIAEREQAEQKFLATLRYELQNLVPNGPNLFHILPREHEAYIVLNALSSPGVPVSSMPLLTRYEVLLRLRTFKTSLFDVSRRLDKAALAELLQRAGRVENEFRAELEALEALMKRKGYKETELSLALYSLRDVMAPKGPVQPLKK
jgi:hypothetical protein